METNLQEVICSFLRLFKKLPSSVYTGNEELEVFEDYGIVTRKLDEAYLGIVEYSIKRVLPEASRFNDTFWKSFQVVATKSQQELWNHAIIHYFTTYGFESLDLDDKSFVYLPEQVVKQAPELTKFFFIQEIEKEDAVSTAFSILDMNTGINVQTIQDCLNILNFYDEPITQDEIDSLKNRESKSFIYQKLGFFPKTAKEIINVLNYIIMGDTLFVKSQDNLQTWSNYSKWESKKENIYYIQHLIKYEANTGTELAQSWFRYKDFLLQLKKLNKSIASNINKISRRAKTEWKPFLESKFITTKIFSDFYYNDEYNHLSQLYFELSDFDVFTLTKIYNKVNYVLNSVSHSSDIFTIRNGKFYLKEESTPIFIRPRILEDILTNIKRIIQSKVNNSIIKFPQNLDLAFPTSEKLFIGDLPYNTVAQFKDASVIGISWKNQGNIRVDLDLSMINDSHERFGWGGPYKDGDLSFIYSGDMTTEGAESFYINKPDSKALLFVNAFNVRNSEYDFFVANEDKDIWKSDNRTLNPNNVVFSTKLSVERESIIGLYVKDSFIFTNLTGSKSNVSSAPRVVLDNLQVIADKAKYSLKLKDIFDDYDKFFEGYRLGFPHLSDEELDSKIREEFDVVDLEVPNKSEVLSLLK